MKKFIEEFSGFLGNGLLDTSSPFKDECVMRIDSAVFTKAARWLRDKTQVTARLLTLVAVDKRKIGNCYEVHAVFYLKELPLLLTLVQELDKKEPAYDALTPIFPVAEWHELEIHDLFGIVPKGIELKPLVLHRDWPRGGHYPMRRDFSAAEEIPCNEVPHQFDMVEVAGRHQVAVGPIHAGIIEPGHMRFSVTGEFIHKFDAQLFYTYKGIEKMAEGKPVEEVLQLAEHVCGLCAFSHSLAFTQALEKMAQIEVSDRVVSIRAILLEMERLASHFADLSAISSAGGFGFTSARAAYFREVILQLNNDLTGHRFLRGFNDIGSLKRDVHAAALKTASEKLTCLAKDFSEWKSLAYNNNGFLDRAENTGFLSKEQALSVGVVGPSARGSGVDEDMRRDFPSGVHSKLNVAVKVYHEGDVFARMRVRVDEVEESISQICRIIATLKCSEPAAKEAVKFTALQPAVGVVESAKGSVVHWIMLDEEGNVYRWNVRSAPYRNWRGLVQATTQDSRGGGNIVPDGPLVNKSFNLCYACCDR